MFHARTSRSSLTPRSSFVLLAVAVAAIAAVALALAAAPAARAAATRAHPKTSSACPWVGSPAPTSAKVADVIDHMSLDDEITMVEGHGTAPPNPYVFYMPGIPSLCIPQLGEEDGPAGVADQLTNVTQLPAGVGLAATFDPSLARQYGQVIGSEELGKGAAVNLGPTVNIDRDPRWGRSFETFTEDPFLNSALTVSEIKGVQSTGEMSQVKHYAAYNQETNRNTPQDDVIVSTRTLREIYEPAFQAAVQNANVASVMCSYSTINGDYACQNNTLLNGTLKQLWDFQGFVTSDYAALHDVSGAVDGTDQEQPFADSFGATLEQDVENGTIPRAVLNTMVSRMLTEMFRFGIIDHPPTGTPSDPVTTPAHVAVATNVADQAATLLKNSAKTLPLSANHGGTVAVIGPSASASPTYGGGGSAYVIPPSTVSPLQGLEAAAGHRTHLLYQQGLPTDASLPAIPSSALSPAYAPTPYGGSYTGTLTAPETGTYVLAIDNPCGCYTPTYLSLDGKQIIDDPSTPPEHLYSAAVQLVAGQTYSLSISGDSDELLWGTPSALAPGIDDAVAAAKSSDSAVVVVSDDTESEATDRLSLSLPSAQDELIEKVAAVNPHTVVVINAGAPVTMPWLGQVGAVLDDWYPGQVDGTSLARVLFGKVNPGGHLPVTFPTGLSQVPASTPAQFPGVDGKVQYSEGLDVGYRWYDAQNLTPLFPFGYGLSYTKFAFSNLRVIGAPGNGVSDMHVTATVTNIGQRAGSDVAQLYLGDPSTTGEPPRQLVGFKRVNLRPGQSSQVLFTVTPRDTWWWDESANGWDQSTGHYGIFAGDSSALSDLPLRSGFDLGATAGARQVQIQSPATMQAGKASVVTVTLTRSGDATLHGVTLALQLPQGWKATALRNATFGKVAPSAAPTVSFRVTPPKYTPATNATVHATAALGPDAVRQAGVNVGVS
ncbi:MAG TPA: glycoside hydrolase family 3 C-terminal domain-containing protein [Solirubrobacteraceae bacterium]|nr:glycoside hydrolase family 3 C-terminal domain-containing protein [Solirubrobacteraceae bacterium]